MPDFGMILSRAVVQSTIMLLIVTVVLLSARKVNSAVRVRMILAGIFGVIALSALAFSPWPSWSRSSNAESTIDTVTEELEPTVSADSPSTVSSSTESAPAQSQKVADSESVWSAAWSAFTESLRTTPIEIEPTVTTRDETPSPSRGWMFWLLIAFAVGVGLGLLRMVVGLCLLMRIVRKSEPVDHARIKEAFEKIELSSQPDVRVSRVLQSPATAGFFRPTILLPAHWEEWTPEELHAVLAHESHHVARRDCLTVLFAELGRIVHFYHPLMHWLTARLRLEQELAADAYASNSLGGQDRYLRILAEMALKGDSRQPAWPARAFFPSRRTFLRRIEMLKRRPLPDRPRTLTQVMSFATLFAVMIFAVGLCKTDREILAQDKDTPPQKSLPEIATVTQSQDVSSTQKAPEAFPLTYAPVDSIGIFAIRPQHMLKQPLLANIGKFVKELPIVDQLGVPIENVEQVVLAIGSHDVPGNPPMLTSAYVRTSTRLELNKVKGHFLEVVRRSDRDFSTGFYGGQLYLTASKHGLSFWLADEHTLIFSDSETGLKQAIDARNLAIREENRIPQWAKVSQKSIAVCGNIAILRRLLQSRQPQPGPGFDSPPTAKQMGLNPMFGPLWLDVDQVVGGIVVTDSLAMNVWGHSSNANSAGRVKRTLDALVTLGQNAVEQNQLMMGQISGKEKEIIAPLLETTRQLFKTVAVRQSDNETRFDVSLSKETAKTLTTALLPAIQSARTAAQRAAGKNNLKQIAIAFHNYHDTFREFPTAVMTGPDGKTKYSWRVAILPYLDEQELAERYRKNEPWDSPHNKALLKEMPAVFRFPGDKKSSTNTSYFALSGAKTMWGDGSIRIGFRDILDGASNTLMVIEGKKDIPWTKPEDINYSGKRDEKPPVLGGWLNNGFQAAFGDGSAQFLSSEIDAQTLRNLIERADGNVVNRQNFDGTAQPGPIDVEIPNGIDAETSEEAEPVDSGGAAASVPE